MPLKNPDQVGCKINNSRWVWQVVDWMQRGTSIAKCCRLLEERFGYRASVPSMSGFRRNFLPKRIKQREADIEERSANENNRIQTFIDEAYTQAHAVKKAIASITRHIAMLEEDVEFSNKFNKLYRTAVDNFVQDFDPEEPHTLFSDEGDLSPEERAVMEMRDYLQDESSSLSAYISGHSPQASVRLIATLNKQLLDHRLSIEKIYHNIFKSYRNYSIMQEIMVIFEKYNEIIVSEFFSDREHLDQDRYQSVRRKIFVLFNELQARYQTYEGPKDSVSEADASTSTKTKSRTKKSKAASQTQTASESRSPTVDDGLQPEYLNRVRMGGTPPPPPPESEASAEELVEKIVERLEHRRGQPQKPVNPKLADLNTKLNKS